MIFFFFEALTDGLYSGSPYLGDLFLFFSVADVQLNTVQLSTIDFQ